MFVSVCRDLQLEEYVDLYWRDYPSIISGFTESCLIDQGKAYLIVCNIIKSGNGQDMLNRRMDGLLLVKAVLSAFLCISWTPKGAANVNKCKTNLHDEAL